MEYVCRALFKMCLNFFIFYKKYYVINALKKDLLNCSFAGYIKIIEEL